ncbi:MAG TPA: ArsC family (seleno)protein [Gemmatales bacterium]|nr:ArsC family (seleno)protein [Gemmatales bacterium]HMP15870.1 ArsC family (seleno)protein [Gemmatales bacterium]
MATLDWYYRRNNCKTCEKADAFLEEHAIRAREIVDARKETHSQTEALALAKSVNVIHTIKGKNLLTLDLKKDKPDTDTILAALLGPTGNLRAPTFRKGKTLFVGFHPEGYAKVLGLS